VKKLFGFSTWKPGQLQSVYAVQALQRDLVCAISPGGGKTAIFVLASHLNSGSTLVILPILELIHDTYERLLKLNESVCYLCSLDTQHVNDGPAAKGKFRIGACSCCFNPH